MTRSKRPVNLEAVRASLARLDALVAAHPELTSPEAQARLGRTIEEQSNMAASDDTLDHNLGIRCSAEDIERLDAVAEKFPFAKRHAIARAALRLGLDLIERDPSALVKGPTPAKRKGR